MTFLFEDIVSGDMRYINAFNLESAIDIFKSHKESSDSSDFDHQYVYVRII